MDTGVTELDIKRCDVSCIGSQSSERPGM